MRHTVVNNMLIYCIGIQNRLSVSFIAYLLSVKDIYHYLMDLS